MKTLSEHPLLIARLLAADEARRLRRAAWRAWRQRWDVRLAALGLGCLLAFVLGWHLTRALSTLN